MLEIFILSITSFLGTNIDDMIINTFFFSSAKSKKEIRSIILGKYIGIGLLVLVSVLVSLGLGFLPMKYIGYLGLIPIALGIKEIISNYKKDDDEDSKTENIKGSDLIWNVALVTIANGADNIGVYIPLFAGFSFIEYAIFCGVFLLLIALWCVLGQQIAKLPSLKNMIDRYKKVIVPSIYILLGLYILLKSAL